jgi:hypothetical protein
MLKCEKVPQIYIDEDGMLHIEGGTFSGPGTIESVSLALLRRINVLLEVKAEVICEDLEVV